MLGHKPSSRFRDEVESDRTELQICSSGALMHTYRYVHPHTAYTTHTHTREREREIGKWTIQLTF